MNLPQRVVLGAGWTARALLLGLLLVPGAAPAQEKPAEKPDERFGFTKVWQLHLDFSAQEWERMQPAGGPRFPGFGGPPAPTPKPPEKPGEEPPEIHRSVFGMEFPWAHADLTAEGTTYKNLGVRYKGNGSYMPSMGKLKRNLKLDLDHYDADQRFHGMKALNLNAGAADPTRGHEALAYAVYRAAGVPASRTAFAEVTLTVPGKYDKEYLGLYTLVEQVDRAFLEARFKSGKGLLLKPERLPGLAYLGDDWAKYTAQYQPKREATKKEARRVIEFVKLVNGADVEKFRKEIESYLDVDRFLRFLAATAMLSNLDSFFGLGHNYYLYLDPKTDRFIFIPWDLDLAFAGLPFLGTPDQQMDLSLTHPYAGENKLTERLLAMKDVSEKYQQILKEIASTAFAKEKLLKDIETVEQTTKPIADKEKKATAARKEGTGGGLFPAGMFVQTPSLKRFVEKRTASVAAQLEGKSKGYVPTSGFGAGQRPPENFLSKPMMEAMDSDRDGKLTKEELIGGVKRFFADNDKEKKGSLDEKQTAEGINRIFPQMPGPAGAAPPAQPAGFGVGNFMAGPLVKRLDADKDSKITVEEAVAVVEELFPQLDKEKKGSIVEKQLNDGFRLLFPPPPGFGQPPPKP